MRTGLGWARNDAMEEKSRVDHEGPHKPGREAKRPSGRREASGRVTESGLEGEASVAR